MFLQRDFIIKKQLQANRMAEPKQNINAETIKKLKHKAL